MALLFYLMPTYLVSQILLLLFQALESPLRKKACYTSNIIPKRLAKEAAWQDKLIVFKVRQEAELSF